MEGESYARARRASSRSEDATRPGDVRPRGSLPVRLRLRSRYVRIAVDLSQRQHPTLLRSVRVWSSRVEPALELVHAVECLVAAQIPEAVSIKIEFAASL